MEIFHVQLVQDSGHLILDGWILDREPAQIRESLCRAVSSLFLSQPPRGLGKKA